MSPMKIKPIKNPLDKLPEILKRNLDQNLCTCNDVPTMDVIHAIANGARTVEEVKNITLATDGIGCCTKQVERLIECICAKEPIFSDIDTITREKRT